MIDSIPDSISPSGLHQRFTQKAVDFLKECFATCLKIAINNQMEIAIKQFSKFEKILLFDSTLWDINENLSKTFKGFGGDASKAGCKLQVVYNVKTSLLEFIELTSATLPDNKYTDNIPDIIGPNTIAIFDLGYFKMSTYKNIIEKKGFYISRLLNGTNIYNYKNNVYKKVDLKKLLNEKNKNGIESFEIEAYIGYTMKTRIKTRIIFDKLPLVEIKKRKKILYKNAKKRNCKPTKISLLLCNWNMYITNISQEELSIKEIIAFYKIRWTIELLFKQFKSIIKIDESNHKNEFRLQCEIYGKLIVICFNQLLFSKMNAYCIIEKNEELSFEKLYKFLNNNASKIYDYILKGNKYLFLFFKQKFYNIIKLCKKIYQPSRKTSFQNLFDNFQEESCEF